MPSFALTGGYGTGKTTVLNILRKSGAYTVNADKIVHNILKRPAVVKKITAILGDDVKIKRAGAVSLSRGRIADIIFRSPDKRELIEDIIHPEVFREIRAAGDKIFSRDPSAVIIFEIPLLFEGNYQRLFDAVIVVFCRKDSALKRLKKKGISVEKALSRMKAQLPITRKKALADFLIDNNGKISDTEAKTKRVLKRLRSTAQPCRRVLSPRHQSFSGQ